MKAWKNMKPSNTNFGLYVVYESLDGIECILTQDTEHYRKY